MTRFTRLMRLIVGMRHLGLTSKNSTGTIGSTFDLSDGDPITFFSDESNTLDEHLYNTCLWYLNNNNAHISP